GAVICAREIATFRQGADSSRLNRSVDRQGVTVLVGLEVRDHMRGRGVARTRPKGHRPTRQGTVSGRGEEFQAVPIMLPGPAGVFIGVEDRETQSPARPVAGGIPVESV